MIQHSVPLASRSTFSRLFIWQQYLIANMNIKPKTSNSLFSSAQRISWSTSCEEEKRWGYHVGVRGHSKQICGIAGLNSSAKRISMYAQLKHKTYFRNQSLQKRNIKYLGAKIHLSISILHFCLMTYAWIATNPEYFGKDLNLSEMEELSH